MVHFPIFKKNFKKNHKIALTTDSLNIWVATVIPYVLGSTAATQYIILLKKTNVSLLSPSRTDLSHPLNPRRTRSPTVLCRVNASARPVQEEEFVLPPFA
jgi:hypothetical protein